MTPSERAKALHEASKILQPQWGIPKAVGVVVSQETPAELIDGNLHTWLSAKKLGVELVHDTHFVFVNPPVDGIDNNRTILKTIINDALLKHMGHKI